MMPRAAARHETVSDMRRGACPTLGEPMPTGDGLLARLRPLDCLITTAELRTIAEAAAEFGNGILEVTARGSLQIRGLRPETVKPFERAVLACGIVPASGVMVEVPPLAGIDPGALIDPRPLAREIRQAIESHVLPLVLAPKLAVTVDGGGRFHLGDVTADVRLTAIDGDRFLLAVGCTNRTARPVAVLTTDGAAPAVIRVLEAIADIGPAMRGRDIDIRKLGFSEPVFGDSSVPGRAGPFLGIHSLGQSSAASGMRVLGIALPYRQAKAADLIAFLNDIETIGTSEIRLAPGHGFFITGLSLDSAFQAEAIARHHGFWTSPDDPRANIALCSGTTGCASAFYDTRAAAGTLLKHAPELLDGSLAIHLSGCAKGCAHPSATPLTIVGAPSGYGLVVNGAASAGPAHYIAAKDLGIALERLASLVAGAKEAGETARDCLARLGADRISAALTLD
jgi:precorrin-3B synthase